MVCLACFVAILAGTANAVRSGDELFESEVNGLFYVPADKSIDIIDPFTLKLVKSITVDNEGNPLVGPTGEPRTWGDAVYIEDPSKENYYIFLNEGDEYSGPNGTTYSYISVIDTVKQEIVARVKGSPRFVHGYAIPELNEFWAHSDGAAVFNAIDLDNAGVLKGRPVKALTTSKAHGKLLVDTRLTPLAYSTNTGEQNLFEINLEKEALVGTYNYSSQLLDSSQCIGTHSIGYSRLNNHLFVECIGGGGTLEWDVSANKLAHQWPNTTGGVYSSHDKDSQFVLVSDQKNSRAVVFQPNKNSQASTTKYIASVPGNPGSPIFYPVKNDTSSFSKYIVFFPLNRITNKVNIAAVKALGASAPGDVTTPGYLDAPFDCKYETAATTHAAHGQRRLLHGDAPSTALKLARNATTGQPLTPLCGSCAPQNISDFDATLSGVAWVDVEELIRNTAAGLNTTANFIPAGTVRPGQPYSADVNECSYGGNHRSGKRGGNFIAIFADIPQPSIYIIDASTQTLKGIVPTAPHPSRVSWAPTRTYSDERAARTTLDANATTPQTSGSERSATACVAALAIGAAGLFAALA